MKSNIALPTSIMQRCSTISGCRATPNTALSAPNTVVLTKSLAQKYFGKSEAMGQVIRLDNQFDLKVTGIIKDLPPNTHLPYQFFVSFATIRKEFDPLEENFYQIRNGAFTYIVTPVKYDINKWQRQMPAFIAVY